MNKVVLVIMLIGLASLVNAESIFLSDYMYEGQTKVYETDGGVYVLNLLVVSDVREKAVFRLNDEMSKGIKLKDSYVFEDGSEIVIRELILNADTKDEAYYYFYGTGKKTLPLTNVSSYAIEDLCNFDRQCLNETKGDCCYDCGCNEEAECVNNRCIPTEKENIEGEEEEAEVVKEATTTPGEKEDDNGLTKEGREKRAARAMVLIIGFFFLVIVWFVLKKKRKKSIF